MPCPPVVRFSLVVASVMLAACNKETSPDVAKAADAAPPAAMTAADSSATVSDVTAAMRKVYDGFVSRDTVGVGAAVPATGMLYVSPGGVMPVMPPAGTTAMVKACDVKSYAMDSVQTRIPAPGAVVLAFKLTIDETCGGQKSPSPVYVLSTWEKDGGQWRAVAFTAVPAQGTK
jgi:hypothetical protein